MDRSIRKCLKLDQKDKGKLTLFISINFPGILSCIKYISNFDSIFLRINPINNFVVSVY